MPRSPATPDPVERAIRRLVRQQSGVISRAQVLDLGASRADLRRHLRRRDWVRVHPGVYVAHTGPLTRVQREWAAVLVAWPAALHRESALWSAGLTRDRDRRSASDPVHVAVEATRSLRGAPGVVVERVRGLQRWVDAHRRPPRVRVEFALLKAAAARDEAGAVALLSDAVHQGLTTPARILDTLELLPRLPGRARVTTLLEDVTTGSRSVLEHRYLQEVERRHGLPEGTRQHRESTLEGTVYRDVRYPAYRTLVELDGAFGHRDLEDRGRDLQRDLHALEAGEVTLRVGWHQVLDPCRLAASVGRVLQTRGWGGSVRPCGATCVGAIPPPG